MIRRCPIPLIAALSILPLLQSTACATSYWRLTLTEMAQRADLIFTGVVDGAVSRWNDSHTLILTDVTFRDVVVEHASPQSRQAGATRITLAYVGGRVGNDVLQVAGHPEFEPGERYVVLAKDDGVLRENFLMGGPQAYFRVVSDPASGLQTLVDESGRIVTGVDPQGYVELSAAGSLPASSARSAGPGVPGLAELAASPPVAEDARDRFDPAPASPAVAAPPLDLVAVLERVRDAVSGLRVPSVLDCVGPGTGILRAEDGSTYTEALPLERPAESAFAPQPQARLVPLAGAESPGSGSGVASGPVSSAATLGDPLGWCGYQNIPIVMEQVPTSWSWFGPINDCMYTWNVFASIYQFRYSDGVVGRNGQNEFCGWLDSDTFQRIYGYTWALGQIARVAGAWECECCRITETDIVLNPAFDWTTDALTATTRLNTVLFQSAIMHELGHTLGFQTATAGPYRETTYAYDVLTVMFGWTPAIWETGWGIHAADAYMLRRNYVSRATIPTALDVGVESYHGHAGPLNAMISPKTLGWGDALTLSDVVVENIGNQALSDVRLRFFLSKDRTLGLSDVQLGSYWYWTSFCAECTLVGSYTMSVPQGVAGGAYNVLAIVNRNGWDYDDYSSNNTTVFALPVTILNPPPTVSSASPGTVERAQSLLLTVNGSGFVSGATRANLQSGIDVTGVTVDSPTQLTLHLVVSPDARLGAYDLAVANPTPGGGSVVLRSALVVGVPVWPGDATNDGAVDARDLLPLGCYWGVTGPARAGGTTWGRQMLTGDWSPALSAYADCDGNGEVSADDVKPIATNWRRTRSGPQVESNLEQACQEMLTALEGGPNDGPTGEMRRAIRELMTGGKDAGAPLRSVVNTPNPFRLATAIHFDVPQAGLPVVVDVVNVQGARVWKTELRPTSAGGQRVVWDGRTSAGHEVPAGIYFCRVTAGSEVATRRMLVIR